MGDFLSLLVVTLLAGTLYFARRNQRLQRENNEQFGELIATLRREWSTQRTALDQLLSRQPAAPPSTPVHETPAATESPLPTAEPEVVFEEPPTAPPAPRETVPPVAPQNAHPFGTAKSGPVAPRLAPRALPAAPAPRPERVPNAFELAARQALTKTWNWIVVGQEHRPEGVSLEYAIASNWLLRIGVVILVMGIGFFLKYSVENGMLGELGRVSLSIITGVVLVAVGTRLLGKTYHLLGQGLMGAGLATLYFAIFAAANLYHLIDLLPAFALMAVVTAAAGALAVLYRSLLVAILGIVGGYATPLMLGGGEPNFVGLYTYMLVLGLGVLGISFVRNWRLLVWLSFVGNYLLFMLSLGAYEPQDFWEVFPFLVGFFMLFSTAIFIFNVVNRQKSTLLELLGLWTNAGAFIAAAYYLIADDFGSEYVAIVAVGTSVFFILHVVFLLQRKIHDKPLLLSFIGLAAVLLSIALPLALSAEWLTSSWALQALAMMWLAGKLNSRFLRQLAYALYAIVVARFAFVDLPEQYLLGTAETSYAVDYVRGLVERLVMFGIPIASLALGCRLVQRPPAAGELAVPQEDDVQAWLADRWALVLGGSLALGTLFVALHLELNRTFHYFFEPARMTVLTFLWAAMCLLLLRLYRSYPIRPALVALLVFVAGMLVKLFAFDLPYWDVSERMHYDRDYSFLDATMRSLDFGLVAGFLVLAFQQLISSTTTRRVAALLAGVAIFLALVWSTLELHSFLEQFVPGMESGGVSVLWSLFALSLIVAGIHRRQRILRFAGLGLFAVAVWKIFFVDLAQLDQLYRIVAFILLGVLTLCGSFVYLKYRSTFAAEAPPEENST